VEQKKQEKEAEKKALADIKKTLSISLKEAKKALNDEKKKLKNNV
jgi:hypothetical protein